MSSTRRVTGCPRALDWPPYQQEVTAAVGYVVIAAGLAALMDLKLALAARAGIGRMTCDHRSAGPNGHEGAAVPQPINTPAKVRTGTAR